MDLNLDMGAASVSCGCDEKFDFKLRIKFKCRSDHRQDAKPTELCGLDQKRIQCDSGVIFTSIILCVASSLLKSNVFISLVPKRNTRYFRFLIAKPNQTNPNPAHIRLKGIIKRIIKVNSHKPLYVHAYTGWTFVQIKRNYPI